VGLDEQFKVNFKSRNSMKKYRVISALLAPIVMLGALVGIASPAAASTSDATLSSLQVNGSNREVSDLQPSFQVDKTWYTVATSRSEIDFYAETTDPNATISFKRNSTVEPAVSAQWITLSDFEVAVTEVIVEVVASDLITKKEYRIFVQRGVMMQPKIISISDNTLSNMGGDRITVQVQNAFPNSYSQDIACYPNFDQVRPDGKTAGMNYSFQDLDGDEKPDYDNNGVSTWRLETYNYEDDYVGPVGIKVGISCSIRSAASNWDEMNASSVFNNAATLARPVFESLVIDKNSATPRGIFSITGLHINSLADIEVMLYDPAKPDERLTGYANNWYKDDTTATIQFRRIPENTDGDYVINEDWKKPGKRTLLILNCGNEDVKNCEDDDTEELKTPAQLIALGVVMHTAQVDYTPAFPSSVSITPNKGSLKGGNRFRIKGFNIMNRRQWEPPVIKIGGKTVTDVQWGQWDQDNPREQDIFEGTIPAGVTPGSVPITVTTEWGEFTVAAKYTYSGAPVISSIAPATVSNAGGALITLTGTNFGTIGTPSVTIDGIKSPCVTRVSDTTVVAMIPEGASSGSVEVNIISGAGGGPAISPATVELVASTTLPTATKFTPTSVAIGGGDEIVITGTNFGAVGTVGVTVGGNCARVISSTATSITIETPSGDAAGAADVIIGATTGSVTKVGAVTFVPNEGVASVTPNTIATTATSAQARVQIVGYGFGAAGTIKIGSAAAIAYTSTESGTKISNILIPTSAAGNVAIQITPTGKTEPYYTSVAVKAPTVTYLGPNPRQSQFEMGTGQRWSDSIGYKVSGTTVGGTAIRIEGTGFGTSGTVKFDNTVVTPSSWTNTEIILTSPALAAGAYDLQIVPSAGPAVPKLSDWFFVSGTQFTQAIISEINSLVDNGRVNEPFTFNPYLDISDVFVVTGSGFTGTDNGVSTKVSMKRYQWADANETVVVTPYDITATSFKFRASRAFAPVNWYGLEITTNIATGWQDQSVLYVGNPPPGVSFGPDRGLCLKDPVSGYSPSGFTLTGSDVFGESGTITMEGEVVPQAAITWSASEISVDFSSFPTNLVNPWGRKSVLFTPDDNKLLPYRFDFNCAVSTTVTTKLNASTDDLTIPAGTAYTASATLDNALPGTTFTLYEDGYEYVTAEDYSNNGFDYNRQRGLPVGAGEYYVRAIVNGQTYDNVKYWEVSNANFVKLTITGTPISFTPKLTGSNAVEIFYRGQLGDGTGGSNADISYTAVITPATPADVITKVVWEYRVAECNSPWWNSGLPEAPAYIYNNNCSIPQGSIGTYDIRVRSFEMKSGATDRSIYYRPTYEIFNLNIKKKAITITEVKAEKVWDGNTDISIRDAVVSGAVTGDGNVPELYYTNSASFADASPGTGKPLTLNGPIVLGGGWAQRYELTNPNPVFTGTIKKADAFLSLVPSVGSVIMTANVPVEITATSRDTRNNNDIIEQPGVAPIVLTSTTASVCTISGTTVTVLKSGNCVIAGNQAASTNYNAAQADSDRAETTELLTIYVFAAPKSVQIVADDVTVAVGENIELSSQAVGLIGDDALSNVGYDIYQGANLLPEMPTEPGTYRILPRDANITMADSAAYNPEFRYVAGKLIITASAPTLEAITANSGPESGGNKVVIKGENLQQVTSIIFAGKTYRKPAFTVNGAGTEITITAPAGKGEVEVVIRAGVIELTGIYTYIPDVVRPPVVNPPVVVTGPTSLSLVMPLAPGSKLKGQVATLSGSGLKAKSAYTLVMGSKKKLIVSGTTNSKGAFTKKITLTRSVCVGTGNQDLVLTGTKPNNSKVAVESAFALNAACELTTAQVVKAIKKGKTTWTMSGFSFDYRKADLTPVAVKSLTLLLKKIRGAKLITITGYTETDTKSPEVKAANIVLAKDRAVSVMNFLKRTLKTSKYLTYGKGGVNPLSLKDQALNRRVVIEASF
jgi:outer membrane protein OmpA-like peptidoglycan-associated protein